MTSTTTPHTGGGYRSIRRAHWPQKSPPAGHTLSIGDYPTAGLTFDPVKEQLYITVQSNIPQGFTVDEVIQVQMASNGLTIQSVVDSYPLSELVGHTPDQNAHVAGTTFDQLPT